MNFIINTLFIIAGISTIVYAVDNVTSWPLLIVGAILCRVHFEYTRH